MSVYVALTLKDGDTNIGPLLEHCEKLNITPNIIDARLSQYSADAEIITELSELEILRKHVQAASVGQFDKIWFLSGDLDVIQNPNDYTLVRDLTVFDYFSDTSLVQPFGVDRSLELYPNCGENWVLEKVGSTLYNKVYSVSKLVNVLAQLKDLTVCNAFTDIIINALYLRECNNIDFLNQTLITYNTSNNVFNKVWDTLKLNSYICNLPETISVVNSLLSDFEREHLFNIDKGAEYLISRLLYKISNYENKDDYFNVLCGLIPNESMRNIILYSNFDDTVKINMLKMLDVQHG